MLVRDRGLNAASHAHEPPAEGIEQALEQLPAAGTGILALHDLIPLGRLCEGCLRLWLCHAEIVGPYGFKGATASLRIGDDFAEWRREQPTFVSAITLRLARPLRNRARSPADPRRFHRR